MRITMTITTMLLVSLPIGASAQNIPQGAIPADIQQNCMADYSRLCPAVIPGGGRIIACFRQNAEQVSPQCRKAIMAYKDDPRYRSIGR
jgi:hypothetical protein